MEFAIECPEFRISRIPESQQVPPEELEHADRGDRHRVGAQRARAERHQPDAARRPRPTTPARSSRLRVRRRRWRRRAPAPSQHGDVLDARPPRSARRASAAAPAAARRAGLEASAACGSRAATARRDCFTDASATRRQRSRRAPCISAATVVFRPLRHDRLNRGDAEHHRVADDVVHLVAFEDGLRERQRDGRLGGRLDARQQLHAHVAAAPRWPRARGTRGRGRRTPTRCRRRRAAARASGAPPRPAAASTVSSPGSSDGAKNRCTAGLYGATSSTIGHGA